MAPRAVRRPVKQSQTDVQSDRRPERWPLCGCCLGLAFLLFFTACSAPGRHQLRPIRTIAFGSCINANSHPMLDRMLRTPFDLAVLLGDNIYADTTNMAVMRTKYDRL